MHREKSTSVKIPCLACRARHLKCGDRKPRCQRCEDKDIDCVRPQRANVFLKGTSAAYDANFPPSQNWVNSRPNKFCGKKLSPDESYATLPGSSPQKQSIEERSAWHNVSGIPHSTTGSLNKNSPEVEISRSQIRRSELSQERTSPIRLLSTASIASEAVGSTPSFSPLLVATNDVHSCHLASPQDYAQALVPVHTSDHSPSFLHSVESEAPSFTRTSQHLSLGSPPGDCMIEPLQDVTEACLFRYYAEELGHWFDTCDPLRHFQLAVQRRARGCPPLLHAIFAVAARHLVRVPQYKTPQGIVYYGQLLPNLTRYTGVEYVLKCIPFLQKFHTIHDDEYQENLMAATVILRQYEEIEDEEEPAGLAEDDDNSFSHSRSHVDQQLNFLAIIQEIIRIAKSSRMSRSLANAAFIVSVRQEVYCAFTRERVPQIHVDRGAWEGMSLANKIVMHAAEVMKWRWGDRSVSEWSRLKAQHLRLDQRSVREFVPVLERTVDRAKQEIFPTKWYSSDADVVGLQHLDLARMVLIAENPHIENSPRPLVARRQAEAQVRALVLNICGIGICHPRMPPALVSGAMAIMTYGDYFTDASERQALSDVIEKTNGYCAWPVFKAVQRLHHDWDVKAGSDELMNTL